MRGFPFAFHFVAREPVRSRYEVFAFHLRALPVVSSHRSIAVGLPARSSSVIPPRAPPIVERLFRQPALLGVVGFPFLDAQGQVVSGATLRRSRPASGAAPCRRLPRRAGRRSGGPTSRAPPGARDNGHSMSNRTAPDGGVCHSRERASSQGRVRLMRIVGALVSSLPGVFAWPLSRDRASRRGSPRRPPAEPTEGLRPRGGEQRPRARLWSSGESRPCASEPPRAAAPAWPREYPRSRSLHPAGCGNRGSRAIRARSAAVRRCRTVGGVRFAFMRGPFDCGGSLRPSGAWPACAGAAPPGAPDLRSSAFAIRARSRGSAPRPSHRGRTLMTCLVGVFCGPRPRRLASASAACTPAASAMSGSARLDRRPRSGSADCQRRTG